MGSGPKKHEWDHRKVGGGGERRAEVQQANEPWGQLETGPRKAVQEPEGRGQGQGTGVPALLPLLGAQSLPGREVRALSAILTPCWPSFHPNYRVLRFHS